jgi:hypothetical protein
VKKRSQTRDRFKGIIILCPLGRLCKICQQILRSPPTCLYIGVFLPTLQMLQSRAVPPIFPISHATSHHETFFCCHKSRTHNRQSIFASPRNPITLIAPVRWSQQTESHPQNNQRNSTPSNTINIRTTSTLPDRRANSGRPSTPRRTNCRSRQR